MIHGFTERFKRKYLIIRGKNLMYEKYSENLDSYAFRFMDNVSSPAFQLTSAGRETRTRPDYHYKNTERSEEYLIQYTLSGEGVVRVKDKVYHAKSNQAFLLSFPGDSEYYFDPQNAESWTFVFVTFKGAAAETYVDYIAEKNGPVFDLPGDHPAVREMMEIHESAKAGRLTDAFTTGKQVFSLLCALCAGDTQREKNTSTLVQRAVSVFRENFHERRGVGDAAAALGVSQSHLSRAFLKDMGIKPVLYLTRLRLEEAVRLLNTTALSINEIAEKCGFDNGNYFCKVFKKYMGVSPTDFRVQMEKQHYSSVQL